MKKKLLVMGSALTLGSGLLITSAYAGIGDAPGYEAYKSAIKNTISVQNVTEKASLSVQDNGAELLQVNSTVKADKSKHNASAAIEVQSGSTKETFDLYSQADKKIMKSSRSDTYSIFEFGAGKHKNRHKEDDSNTDGVESSEIENVVDALVGNLKDYVQLTPQSDGTKTIEVQLNSSQIPAAANAIGSLLVKEGVSDDHQEKTQDFPFENDIKEIKSSLPKLTQDIRINNVALNATVDSQNHITNQKVNLTVTGKDDNGVSHELVVSANIDLSNFNSTTPDSVDLTGKKTQTVNINRDHFHED